MTTSTIPAAQPAMPAMRAIGYLPVAGIVSFFVAVLVLHALAPEFDPRLRFISEYAHSSYGFLLNAGFIALGVGSLALAWLLTRSQQFKGTRDKIGIALLAVWGAAVVLDGFFAIDPGVEPVTLPGTIHMFAAMVAFLSLMVASVLLSLGFQEKEITRGISRLALVLVALIFGSFILFNVMPDAQGWTQRLFVFFCIAWLFMVAVTVPFARGKNGIH